MTDMEAYRQTLARMESDLAKADARAKRLRDGIAALRDIIDADEFADPSGKPEGQSSSSAHERDRVPEGLTMKGLAVWALERKFPLRIREMFDLLVAHGYTAPERYEQFRGSMAPTLNRTSVFRKIGPGLFSLNPDELEAEKTRSAGNTPGLF